jgi:hypothetical protein
VVTWEHKNGSYDVTFEYPNAPVFRINGDSSPCPEPTYTHNANLDFNYGELQDTRYTYSVPIYRRTEVMEKLASIAPSWSEWSEEETFSNSAGDAFRAFNHYGDDSDDVLFGFHHSTFIQGSDIPLWYASRLVYEFRFSLMVPVACKVIYQIESFNLNSHTITLGEKQELIVTGENVPLTITPTDGVSKSLLINGIQVHPWT